MRICCLRHVVFEGPAGIATWAQAEGHTLTITDVWRAPLPDPSDFDFLVIMGGPMGVHDEREHPFLISEKRLIDAALARGKRMLGVCLGAQLIADVLGARVHRGPAREIGWWPTWCVPGVDGAFASVPETFVPLHWHADTFEIPAGAQRLAASEACPHQAFQFGTDVLALQFHLEATPESVRELVAEAGSKIGSGPWQESAASILARSSEQTTALRPLLASVLGGLTAASR